MKAKNYRLRCNSKTSLRRPERSQRRLRDLQIISLWDVLRRCMRCLKDAPEMHSCWLSIGDHLQMAASVCFPVSYWNLFLSFFEGSQPTWKSGKSGNYQRIWKWTLFHWKIKVLSGNFDWISRKSRKTNTFLENYFLVIKFLPVLLSVMYIFMFWNIFLLFLTIAIVLQPVFLCLKIWVLKCNILDCCIMHHKCIDLYLI